MICATYTDHLCVSGNPHLVYLQMHQTSYICTYASNLALYTAIHAVAHVRTKHTSEGMLILIECLPDELDGIQPRNLACCDSGVPLVLIKVGWHLYSKCIH